MNYNNTLLITKNQRSVYPSIYKLLPYGEVGRGFLKMKKLLSIVSAVILSLSVNAQSVNISIDANHPDHAISPTLFGLFFEDINLSADGGVYRELVRNRSFEDADTLQYWTFSSKNGKAEVINADKQGNPSEKPLNFNNRQYLRVNAQGDFSLVNKGYWVTTQLY